MGHVLASILDKPEHEISQAITKLEEKYGYPSHDVRLLANNIQKTRTKIAELGLDPDDTTPQELYHSLLSHYAADCAHLEQSLGLKAEDGLNKKINYAVELVSSSYPDQDIWGLKLTAAKQAILGGPPKKLMKRLGYRSVESLVKREDIREIIGLSLLVGSKTWLSNWTRTIAQQPTTSFERRPPKIVRISSKNQKKLDLHQDDLLPADTVLGSIFLIPSEELSKVPLLSIALVLIENLEHLGIKATAGRMNPMLDFWSDTSHLLAWKDSRAVSLNMHDVAANHLNNYTFDSRVKDKGVKSLWNELLSRYGKESEAVEQSLQNAAYKLRRVANLPQPLAAEYEYTGA